MWRPTRAQPRKPAISAVLKIASLPIAATVLAACAGTSENGAGQGESNAGANTAPGALAVRDVGGLGPTLVDRSGKTIYFSDQEADGSVRCAGDCLNFWLPVPATGDPAGTGQISGLGEVQRADNGQKQVTYQGRPLYTFSLDGSPGQHAGDNLSDEFAGQQFTWHAVLTGAPAANPAPPSTATDNGYGY